MRAKASHLPLWAWSGWGSTADISTLKSCSSGQEILACKLEVLPNLSPIFRGRDCPPPCCPHVSWAPRGRLGNPLPSHLLTSSRPASWQFIKTPLNWGIREQLRNERACAKHNSHVALPSSDNKCSSCFWCDLFSIRKEHNKLLSRFLVCVTTADFQCEPLFYWTCWRHFLEHSQWGELRYQRVLSGYKCISRGPEGVQRCIRNIEFFFRIRIFKNVMRLWFHTCWMRKSVTLLSFHF